MTPRADFAARGLAFGAYARAMPGQPSCGDGFVVARGAAGWAAALFDGLGHGPDAAHATLRGIATVLALRHLPVMDLTIACHEALARTRGAAGALVVVDQHGLASFAGVGNVDARPLTPGGPSLVCVPGILGHTLRRIHVTLFQLRENDAICLTTDGVATNAHLNLPLVGDACELARGLVERGGRQHDDASCLLIVAPGVRWSGCSLAPGQAYTSAPYGGEPSNPDP